MNHTENIRPSVSKTPLQRIGGVLSTVFTIVLVVILVFMLCSVVFNRGGNGVSLGKYRILNALTGSMEPAIPVGSLIIIQEVGEDPLLVDDIIAYHPLEGSSILVTHRIVGMHGQESYTTKGDANNIEDQNPVHPSQIVGKVLFCIPFLGTLLSLLQRPYFVGTVIALLVLYKVIIQFIMTAKKKKDD